MCMFCFIVLHVIYYVKWMFAVCISVSKWPLMSVVIKVIVVRKCVLELTDSYHVLVMPCHV